MSHKWLKNKNAIRAARDKATRDQRTKVWSLRGSNSSTPPKRSFPPKPSQSSKTSSSSEYFVREFVFHS